MAGDWSAAGSITPSDRSLRSTNASSPIRGSELAAAPRPTFDENLARFAEQPVERRAIGNGVHASLSPARGRRGVDRQVAAVEFDEIGADDENRVGRAVGGIRMAHGKSFVLKNSNNASNVANKLLRIKREQSKQRFLRRLQSLGLTARVA
jgi:hypothetical protein